MGTVGGDWLARPPLASKTKRTLSIPCINRIAFPHVRVNFQSKSYCQSSRRGKVLTILTGVTLQPSSATLEPEGRRFAYSGFRWRWSRDWLLPPASSANGIILIPGMTTIARTAIWITGSSFNQKLPVAMTFSSQLVPCTSLKHLVRPWALFLQTVPRARFIA
jgi:hypothetical protein